MHLGTRQLKTVFLWVVLSSLCSCSRRKTDELLAPGEIVKKYREAKSWEERLNYVKYPEKVRPLMASYYARSPKGFLSPFVEIEKPNKSTVALGEWVGVSVIVSKGKNVFGTTVTESVFYNVQHTPDGYKIDWESSIPYNAMTAAEFKSRRPREPVLFRVMARLSDTYPFGRAAFQQENWSVELTLQNNSTVRNFQYLGTGFILRESEGGKALYELLRDGGNHAVTLEISYPDNPIFTTYFSIDKFVSGNWLHHE